MAAGTAHAPSGNLPPAVPSTCFYGNFPRSAAALLPGRQKAASTCLAGSGLLMSQCGPQNRDRQGRSSFPEGGRASGQWERRAWPPRTALETEANPGGSFTALPFPCPSQDPQAAGQNPRQPTARALTSRRHSTAHPPGKPTARADKVPGSRRLT